MKIFVATALGLPILLVIIDLTDHLQQYLDRQIPRADIALSYVYWMPQSMFMALPAAVLFATVFSIGTFTRHSEITAAKASGISFYRFIAPILLGALLAAGLDLAIGEVVPITDARRNDLLRESKVESGTQRVELRLRGGVRAGVQGADARRDARARLDRLQIERKGNGRGLPDRAHLRRPAPTYDQRERTLDARRRATCTWCATARRAGAAASTSCTTGMMRERPVDLMAKPRDPAGDALLASCRGSSGRWSGRGATPTSCAWSGRSRSRSRSPAW